MQDVLAMHVDCMFPAVQPTMEKNRVNNAAKGSLVPHPGFNCVISCWWHFFGERLCCVFWCSVTAQDRNRPLTFAANVAIHLRKSFKI